MTNETVIVRCQGTTKAGNACKATVGLVDGYCSNHRPNKHKELLEQVKKSKRSGSARKSVKNKPLPGATDELASLIDDAYNHVPGEAVDEETVDVAADVIRISEEIEAKERLEESLTAIVEVRYSIVEAVAILDQYKVLLKYVDVDKVKDKIALAEILVDVVRLEQAEVVKQSILTTKFINELSLKVKYMREDAKAEYDGHIPLDIIMDIQELDKQIFQLKLGKGILMAAIEMHEQGQEEEEIEEDKKPSLFTRFLGYVDKHYKSISATCLILAGIVMVLIALMNANIVQPPVDDSNPPVTVVEDKPVGEHIPADFADVGNAKPADVVRPTAGGHPVDVDDVVSTPVSVTTVTVQDGDTLWDIAVHVYGDGSKWTKIWDDNKDSLTADDVRNVEQPGHWIHPGQDITVSMDSADTMSYHDALTDH